MKQLWRIRYEHKDVGGEFTKEDMSLEEAITALIRVARYRNIAWIQLEPQ